MKKIILTFITIILLSSFIFPVTKLIDVKLKLVLKIGSEEKGNIYKWVGITTDPYKNIYITDMMDYSIKKFNKNGDFIKKTGRKGRGPGEFISPGLIDFCDKKLYMTQQMAPGIQVFDSDLNYKQKIPLTIPIFDLKVCDKNKIFYMSPYINNIMNITRVKGNNLNLINNSELIKKGFLNMGYFDIDSNLNIYKVFQGKNLIEKYNPKGKIIWSKSLNFLKKEAEKTNIKNKLVIFKKYLFKGIQIDKDGIIFVLGGHYSKSKEIFVLDKNGHYIKTIKLKEGTHTIHIANNLLYCRENDGTSIVVYKIIKKKSKKIQ